MDWKERAERRNDRKKLVLAGVQFAAMLPVIYSGLKSGGIFFYVLMALCVMWNVAVWFGEDIAQTVTWWRFRWAARRSR